VLADSAYLRRRFRARARLRRSAKNISQHFQIETERDAKSESFGQSSRIDVHHHIDERFDLCRFARFTDKAHD
jgi:hypothetical protein